MEYTITSTWWSWDAFLVGIHQENPEHWILTIPRYAWSFAQKLPPAQQGGVYILLRDDVREGQSAYIGATYSFSKRIATHQREKSFWQYAYLLGRNEPYLAQQRHYLEYLLHQSIQQDKTIHLENKINPPDIALTLREKEYAHVALQEYRRLLRVLSPLPILRTSTDLTHYYSVRSPAAHIVVDPKNGVWIKKGSHAALNISLFNRGTVIDTIRQQLLTQGIVASQDGMLIFKNDWRAPTLKDACGVVLGRTSNINLDWHCIHGD